MLDTFWRVLFWENVEKHEKTAVFRASTAVLGNYWTGDHGWLGSIGLISKHLLFNVCLSVDFLG